MGDATAIFSIHDKKDYEIHRSLIRKVDRDDLLQAMLRSYLNV